MNQDQFRAQAAAEQQLLALAGIAAALNRIGDKLDCLNGLLADLNAGVNAALGSMDALNGALALAGMPEDETEEPPDYDDPADRQERCINCDSPTHAVCDQVDPDAPYAALAREAADLDDVPF